jgi:hypothetical protein
VATPSSPYTFDRPVGGLPCAVDRLQWVNRLQRQSLQQPLIALLGGPRSGRTTLLQALGHSFEAALHTPVQGGKRVAVYLDLQPLAVGAQTLSPQSIVARFVQALYKAVSEAVSSPFVQAHKDALRPPNFIKANTARPRGQAAAVAYDPLAHFLQLCRTLWQSLSGTPGFCRYVLLLDNADLLLEGPLQCLQGPLMALMGPEPPPPAPPPEAVERPRDAARRAPVKGSGSPSGAPARVLPSVLGRATRRSTAGRAGRGGLRAGSRESADAAAGTGASTGSISPAASLLPHPAGANPAAGRRTAAANRRIGHQSLGPSVAPGVRPARHLAPDVERPIALICSGGALLLRHLAQHAGTAAALPTRPSGGMQAAGERALWRAMRAYPLTALTAAEGQTLLNLGDFSAAPQAADWCHFVSGGQPCVLQAALSCLSHLLATQPQLHDPQADPTGKALVGALQAALDAALEPLFTSILAAFPAFSAIPGTSQPPPKEHLIMRCLLQDPRQAYSLAQLSAAVGHQPLQPALDFLRMCGVVQRSVRGNVECLQATCPLWNAYYAQRS